MRKALLGVAGRLDADHVVGLWGPRRFGKTAAVEEIAAEAGARLVVADVGGAVRETTEDCWLALASLISPAGSPRSATHALQQVLLLEKKDLVILYLRRLELATAHWSEQFVYEVFERWVADSKRGREPWDRLRIVLVSSVAPSELAPDMRDHVQTFVAVPDLTDAEIRELGVPSEGIEQLKPLIGGHPGLWAAVLESTHGSVDWPAVEATLPSPSGPLARLFEELKRHLYATPGLVDACVALAAARPHVFTPEQRRFFLGWGLAATHPTKSDRLVLRYPVFGRWAQRLG